MGHYLSLLHLNPLSRQVNRDIADIVEMHRTIMSAFPEVANGDSPRAKFDVLYRLEVQHRSGKIHLYVQSNIEPQWKELPDTYILSNHNKGIAVKSIEKAYENIQEGMRLRFRLRANPTRKIKTKTATEGQRRHGQRVPVRGELEQVEWLNRQGARCGFRLDSVAITSSGRPELVRSNRHQRTFQGVLYDGVLTVLDREHFKYSLQKGIGPGKSYGFGMMSVFL